MTYKKFLTAIMCAYFFGVACGFLGGYLSRELDCADIQLTDSPNLQVEIAVLKGNIEAINARYNDYAYRIQTIEDRMRIFDHD